jgi:hypothetical protein
VTATLARRPRQRRQDAPAAPAAGAAGIRRLFEATPGRSAHVDARARSLRRLAARYVCEAQYAETRAEHDVALRAAAIVCEMADEAEYFALFVDTAPAMGQGFNTPTAGAGRPRNGVLQDDDGERA